MVRLPHHLHPNRGTRAEVSLPRSQQGGKKVICQLRPGLFGCRSHLLRLPLAESDHQPQVRDHRGHHHLKAGLPSPKVSTLANA